MSALRVATAIIVFITLAPGCSDGGRGMHPDASSLFHCTSNADCDDHIACTIDNCDVSMVCQHNAIDAMCTGAGEHCVVGTGCTTTMSCTDASMCDDHVGCTLDTCNVGHVCGHQPINSMCSAPTPVCDPVHDCVAGMTPQCTTAADCNDSIACTVDSCGVDMMCRHMTVDSSCMSGEVCDATRGCVMRHACTTVADCMDPSFYNFCDGTPVCSPEFGCMFPTPRVCDDGDMCTLDMCDRTAGTNGSCTTACDHSVSGCDADPACVTTTLPCATGVFLITPTQSNHCAPNLRGMNQVNYDVSQVTFMSAGMYIADPGPMPASFGTMTDPAPACPSFSVTATVAGGTPEHYTLAGTFSDADHFTGTFTANYGGFGGLAGCYEGTMSVTGTRM